MTKTDIPIWVQREFRFAFPTEHWPYVIARLVGAPPRLEEATRDLPVDALTERVAGRWSIQENAGHLTDLEVIHDGRLDDYLAGAETLRPADVTNPATEAARHNERTLDDVLDDFRHVRTAFVARLRSLAPADYGRVAKHPRLGTAMRLVDMLVFMAEHDDHHIARILELAP